MTSVNYALMDTEAEHGAVARTLEDELAARKLHQAESARADQALFAGKAQASVLKRTTAAAEAQYNAHLQSREQLVRKLQAATRMAAAAEQHSPASRRPEADAVLMQQQVTSAHKPAQHSLSELEQQGSLLSHSSAQAAPAPSRPDPQAQVLYPNSGRQVAQRTLTEREQQGSSSNNSTNQSSETKPQTDAQSQSWYTLSSSSSTKPAVQRPLSELEQQGALPASAAGQQPNQQQQQPPPLSGRVSPNEAEHVATLRAPGSRSPTRDLTELEQQGSFSLAADSQELEAPNQTQQSPPGIATAELALDVARRKAAQAELERQYSQLQLHHQQACVVSPIEGGMHCTQGPYGILSQHLLHRPTTMASRISASDQPCGHSSGMSPFWHVSHLLHNPEQQLNS